MDLSCRFFLPCIRARSLFLESAYIIGSFHLLCEKGKPVCRPERLIAHLQQVLFQILPACTASIDIRPQASHFPDRSRRRLFFQRRRIMISDHQAESGVRKDQPKGRPFTKCLPSHRHGRQCPIGLLQTAHPFAHRFLPRRRFLPEKSFRKAETFRPESGRYLLRPLILIPPVRCQMRPYTLKRRPAHIFISCSGITFFICHPVM